MMFVRMPSTASRAVDCYVFRSKATWVGGSNGANSLGSDERNGDDSQSWRDDSVVDSAVGGGAPARSRSHSCWSSSSSLVLSLLEEEEEWRGHSTW